jgi:hypothetical protein
MTRRVWGEAQHKVNRRVSWWREVMERKGYRLDEHHRPLSYKVKSKISCQPNVPSPSLSSNQEVCYVHDKLGLLPLPLLRHPFKVSMRLPLVDPLSTIHNHNIPMLLLLLAQQSPLFRRRGPAEDELEIDEVGRPVGFGLVADEVPADDLVGGGEDAEEE